jgi:hypothetical protein
MMHGQPSVKMCLVLLDVSFMLTCFYILLVYSTTAVAENIAVGSMCYTHT